jgi:hypothetical protein
LKVRLNIRIGFFGGGKCLALSNVVNFNLKAQKRLGVVFMSGLYGRFDFSLLGPQRSGPAMVFRVVHLWSIRDIMSDSFQGSHVAGQRLIPIDLGRSRRHQL